MDRSVTFILLFFGFSLSCCSRFPLRKYYHVQIPMNWADAQRYCREKYIDLATFESVDDVRMVTGFTVSWIGLHDDPKSWKYSMGNDTNSWRWSATGETSRTGYQRWAPNEPDGSRENRICVQMLPSGEWEDYGCETYTDLSFVCYNAKTSQSEKTFVFVTTPYYWRLALIYCRLFHTDLAFIENDEENDAVSAMIGNRIVWIGLHRVRWTWSDKSLSPYRSWESGRPDYSLSREHCVYITPSQDWADADCSSKMDFVCHGVPTLKTMIRMKMKTSADITDPATNSQILQQLSAALTRQGLTAFKLKWKTPPRKQKQRTEF